MPGKILSPERFEEIFSEVPRVTVDIVIPRWGGVVMTKRNIPPRKGMWHLPGVGVLYGETVEEAIKRACETEVGLQVEIDLSVGINGLIGLIEYEPVDRFDQVIAIVWQVQAVGELHSSWNGTELQTAETLPKNTIPEVARFLTGAGFLS